MELQLEILVPLVKRYEAATRREKREQILSEALKTLDKTSMLRFLHLAIVHLVVIGKEYEFDE